MDKNKGAIPKGTKPFLRSTKTLRSPPQPIITGDESVYPCELCFAVDNKPIVRCDKCQLWYHFACVNASSDVADYDWFCPSCRLQTPVMNLSQVPEINSKEDQNVISRKEQENPTGFSSEDRNKQNSTSPTVDKNIEDQRVTKSTASSRYRKSKSGTASTSRRKALELQKLEEQRKLELEERERRAKSDKEYLDRKYSILEQTESSEDDLSYDDEEFKTFKRDAVKQWAENVPMGSQSLDAATGNRVKQYLSSTNVGEREEPENRRLDKITQQTAMPFATMVDLSDDESDRRAENNFMTRPTNAQKQLESKPIYSSHLHIPSRTTLTATSVPQWTTSIPVEQHMDKLFALLEPKQLNVKPTVKNIHIQSVPKSTVSSTRQKVPVFNSVKTSMPEDPEDQPINQLKRKFTINELKFPPFGKEPIFPQSQAQHTELRAHMPHQWGIFENQGPQTRPQLQIQGQPVLRTQAFDNQSQQQSYPSNHLVGKQPNQTSVQSSQFAVNQNENSNNPWIIESSRTFTDNNQAPVINYQSQFSSQAIKVNQPPVMSTSVYQSKVGNPPPISSNYQEHQPIVSNYQQPIVSNYQQPIVSNYQQPIVSNYHQPKVSNDQQPITSLYQHQPFGSNRQQPIASFSTNNQLVNADWNDGANYNGNSAPAISNRDGYNGSSAITMQNIMSRQVIDKKLPIFAGNPEEWNAWYNRYVSTTVKCNLDHSENLDRLSKCLKGNAYDIVKSKLSQTEAVPWIISTLQKVFGRPEIILKAVTKRIQNIPPIKNDNLKSMMEFAFEVQSVSTTIESSGLLNQYRNLTLLDDLVDKLPARTKLDWAKYKRGMNNVTIKTFTDWLEELAEDISTVVEPNVEKHHKKSDKRNEKEEAHINVHLENKSRKTEPSISSEASRGSKKSCVTCGKGCQRLEFCSTFNDLSIDRKWKEIKEHKLCRICLKKHKFPCKSTTVCGKNGCSIKHHQLLHNDERNSTLASSHVHHDSSRQVMLKYGPVVLHKNNKKVLTFAFFDDGSQASMVEQSLVDQLGVSGTKEELCLLWTDNIHRKEDAQRISIEISGESDSECRFPLKGIRAVKSLHLPPQTFKKEDLIKQYPHLADVPINDYENAIPGILIASDFPKLGIQLKVIESKIFKGPIAQKTRLGWAVYGPCGGKQENYRVNNHHVIQVCPHHNQLDQEIHQQVKEYFSIDNFGVKANSKTELESKDNQRALDMLNKLTKQVEGRYETGLLWKSDSIKENLPDSYPMAMKRLISLEKQGEKVVKAIGEKINEYVEKGYARKLSDEEIEDLGDDKWYLPVFGVVNPKKPEKLRMVFDGAAKVKSVSLNSMLLTGPDELASLVDILRRLREKLIAVGADIKEMYHQVKIQKCDQGYQLFLFRDGDANRKPDVYVMCVMTFGSRCSPAAAQFVKNSNAKKFEKSHPREVEAIIENHYVDDMMDGENTVESTIKMAKDVKMIHASGGFEIRNFISNSPEVLKAMGDTNIQNNKELSLHSELKTERVLGMWWNTKLDVFTFSLKYTAITKEILDGTKMPTKRELLRTLMSIFDPLGLLSNYLVQLKILLQEVWRNDINWDEQITSKTLVNKWKQWLENLPSVESVQVPRLYSMKLLSEKPKKVEIHTFFDASEDAVSAVSYLRIANEDGVDCALMGSKARVAPLKYLSIPRKELQSAVLGVRLTQSISQAQRFVIDRRIFWSDSETVLSWLKSDHRKYSQFVAHRVGEILDSSDVNEWRWVPTKENVADEATKWSKTMNFQSSNRWFSGPKFLRLNEDEWPKKKIIKSNIEEEMKAHCVHESLVLPQLVDPKRFSKWNRMVRAVAYSIRFRKVFSDKKLKGKPLTQDEITNAENQLFRQAQFEGFPSEMVTLVRNEFLPLNKKKFIERPSALYDGSPYLDGNGILRMRGRIDGARDLSVDTKRPIVLPKDSRITRLLVQHYHSKYFHQNHNTVINEIRQCFYIPRLRAVLKKVRNDCQMCKVKLSKIMEPQMADLPQERLATFAKPFSYVGVDYFGPMKVKIGKRNEKRWGVLFTCLTVRAVHIDLVSSLDADSCIKAIRNFIADRGEVIEFHSDCGTHFTGANNELKQELAKLDVERLQTEFTSSYTKWVFNPPSSPHMGGSWERLIRSV